MTPSSPDTVATVEGLMELARQYAHAYANYYSEGMRDGMLAPCTERLRGAITDLATRLASPAPTLSPESKLPPRPNGWNDASADPDSPLERWGRAKQDGLVLLERRDDGYWTPWHIANEMLRAATHPATSTAPRLPLTDEKITEIADRWFVTGENQRRGNEYYYRSLGTPGNVRGSDLAAFARAIEAELSHPVAPQPTDTEAPK